MFAARFGVGWLADIETVVGFDTNEVSRDTSLVVVTFGGSDVTLAVDVATVTDCVLIIWIAGGFADGGITGRASCASRELTTPKLGARWLVIKLGTGRAIAEGVGDGVELEPVFWRSCFKRTFWLSDSGFALDAEDIVENLHPLPWPVVELTVEDTLLSSVLSTGSLLTIFDASKLRRLLIA